MRLSKISAVLALLFVFLPLFPISAQAEAIPVTSTELIEEATALDGKTVSYKGEVVGDILYRGDHAWINISDGKNAIGVYVPATEAKKVEYVGRYCIVGDTVSLVGTFHRACVEDGGDLDIHANAVTVTEKGHRINPDIPSVGLLIAAGSAFPCALAGIILVIKKRVSYNETHQEI